LRQGPEIDCSVFSYAGVFITEKVSPLRNARFAASDWEKVVREMASQGARSQRRRVVEWKSTGSYWQNQKSVL
jgi:hypothetical protein